MANNTSTRFKDVWKPITVIILIATAFLILMKGNELGQFRYTGPHYWKVFWAMYLLSLLIVSPLIFKKLAPEIFRETSWKERARTAVLLIITAFFPAFILNGVANYIDYFSSNKKWHNITTVIVSIPASRKEKNATTYTYKMRTNRETILLQTTLGYNIGDTLNLKIATTALGNVVAQLR